MAAITIILALMGSYVPVLGTVAALLWPVPVALVYLRHGFRISLLTVIVSGLTLGMFVGPLEAVVRVSTFGLAGLALGFCFRRKLSPSVTVAAGAVAGLVSTVIGLVVSILFFKIGPKEMLAEILQALDQSTEIYRRFGLLSETQIAEVKQQTDVARQMMGYLLPSLFGVSAISGSLVNFQVARMVLNRLGYGIEQLPKFETWRMPALAAIGVFAGGLTGLLKDNQSWSLVYSAGVNIQFFMSVLFLVHGSAVGYWFMANRWNVSKPLRIVMLAMAFFNPLFQQVLLWVGVFDSFFDYRKLGFRFRR